MSFEKIPALPMTENQPSDQPKKRKYTKPSFEEFTVAKEVSSRGVFFDMHKTMKENDELSEYVAKDLRLDVLFDKKSAVELLTEQEKEYELTKKYFPKGMVAKSVFLYPPDMKDAVDEVQKKELKNPYPYKKFIQIQADRRLAGRYGLDERQADRENKLINKGLKAIGDVMQANKEKEFRGAVVQERINGISFQKLFDQENWKKSQKYDLLKTNVEKLIEGLREMHKSEDNAAYTWHGLDSDNVMVEIDDQGEITGRVVIVDTNFLIRPDKIYKNKVVNTLESNVLGPIEEKFGKQPGSKDREKESMTKVAKLKERR